MNRLQLWGWMATFFFISSAQAQNNIQSPKEFMGYAPGEKFAFHHEVIDYFEYVAANTPEVTLIPYGKTNEGRPLVLAVVSSAENIRNLDQIRKNNLIKIGLSNESVQGKHLPIVWLGFSIHGNEASGVNAASPTLYALLSREKPEMQQWLDETLIIIDPCINPDGYARYVNWYRQKRAFPFNVHADTWEHDEPWPGGRYNHYLFDLNRDWAWQSQIESQQRIKIYNQWMPHVLIDFHEMGYNSPYFFAPPAKPQHADVSSWQKEFQTIIGKNHAKHFDENKWLYYSKDVFDLLYPSYGDTWPTFNGAMGYTHEQGGGGRAGIGILMENKDTLYLKDRYLHHKTTALSSIETVFNNREKLLSEFVKYFE
ncbi:MAG: M14 family zinc carboxypeptidase, partial [Bacteroidota bacterium]